MPDDNNNLNDDLQPIEPHPAVVTTNTLIASLENIDVEDSLSDEEAMNIASSSANDAQIRADNALSTGENENEKIVPGLGEVADSVNASWFSVTQFPHYENTKFRAFITDLFSNYTKAPLQDIYRLGGAMDKTAIEEKIAEVGTLRLDHEVDFSALVPGVTSQVKHYESAEGGYLIVDDIGGRAIYGWRNPPKPVPQIAGPKP